MSMKKIFSMFLMICVVFSTLSSTVLATEVDDKIRIGYYTNFSDFIQDSEQENLSGYGYEVFKKIEELSTLSFEFVPIDGSLTDALLDGTVDLAGFAIRTDERLEEVLFSNTAYSKTYVALMTKDMDIRYNTPASIDGKTVATYQDNYAQPYFESYCERNNITVEYVYGDINRYMYLDTDFYITYSEDKSATNLNNILNLGVYNLYLMGGQDSAETLETVDYYFRQIVYTEGNFFWELEEKYFVEHVEMNHRSLTQNEVNILQQRPLEVGYLQDFRPIAYTNELGEPAGSMIDTLNLFAERYGLELNYHPYSLADDPKQHSDYDILLTLYGDVNDMDYEEQYYDSTEAYYSVPMYAQIHLDAYKESASFNDLVENSPRMGVLPYKSIDYDAFLKSFPDNEFIFFDDFVTMLDAFKAHEIDLMLFTESATTYAGLYLDDVETVTMSTTVKLPLTFFVSKDISEPYLRIFNVMLDRISEREYESIMVSNSNEYYPQKSMLAIIQDNWYYFAIVFLLLAAFFSAYAYTKQKQKQRELAKAYNTDALTGFVAFHKFRNIVDETLQKATANEYEMISLDVDMFRTINTHFSNERGTAVIVSISNALRTAFASTSATICRRTADQFLIFRRLDQGGTIRQIYTADILPSIREVLGDKYNISLSFGSVVIENTKERSSTFIGQADNARAHGKQFHKTTFTVFDEVMQKSYEDTINITFRMEQALKDKEFFVEYQPKIDFITLKVGGAEALVRWKPKFGETIYPDDFIPIFEKNGFISTLDLYVLNEVCQFIRANCMKINIPRISVNLSAHTVLSDNITSRIMDILSTYNVKTSEIELELTESAIESDASTFLKRVYQLKQLGFAISIDDFGAGVSSLNRLSAIDADVLKLDKAFFDLKDQGGKSTVVVADVVTMAKHLDMKVVAEGVETSSQALWLKEINCDYAQGYYFAKPLSEDSFRELLLSNKEFAISLI